MKYSEELSKEIGEFKEEIKLNFHKYCLNLVILLLSSFLLWVFLGNISEDSFILKSMVFI